MAKSQNASKLSVKERLSRRAKRLKTDIPAVFWAMKDRETPCLAKALAFLTVAYALSPVDLIPDFIPALGFLDDVILLPLLVAATVKLIPESVLERCREEAKGLWQEGKPKKWYYALPIVAVWALLLMIFLKGIL